MQHISGTVTADATIKQLEDGRKFITFSIADNDSYKPKDSNERVDLTTFFNCTYWLGTGVAKVLRKGAAVDLIGRAWAKPYKDRNDNWNAALNFNASQIRFTKYAPKDEEEAVTATQGKATGKSRKAKAEEAKKDDLPF
ncbi:single-stranded DNA-binding protein [Pedobacter sp. ISL-68]|uniref:single-stranded DNA-binding protein n=1 Tax=unclassified Pedobacter TaxID=2628915 RepID=UPI001BEAC4D8|nr:MULTISPECIES: single-stranded DNA-binding protein [unclassified Pedobacter]MBT2561324.1 single-stranded DNA-binding protein [Pedobacter sp. ISL-64]MBT2590713.1 single-stranded DNA-binding protein [Pedobacter sp. ISL-68]